tara:strand:+ start:144 stop:773 length:630 start_codon:yes stop_codon:yes gene_type:complete
MAPEKTLTAPLRWREPSKVFVNSMGDVFHESIPDEWISQVFAVMEACPQHIFQVLTKRAERMYDHMAGIAAMEPNSGWPPPNVWLGVSVEDRKRTHRIDVLRQVPAAIRFLSLEPLLEGLGEINLSGISWVIVGGESGPKARPCDLANVRSVISQGKAAGVAVFVKQIGSRPFQDGVRFPHQYGLIHDRKGGDPDEWPEDLRVREYPDG